MRNRSLLLLATCLSVYIAFHSCQSEQAIRTAQYTVNGKKVYATHCQNCHGAKGEGLGKLYPPLNDSTFLVSHRDELACLVKYGRKEMPANRTLTTVEIAYVLTYIGNSFGNTMEMFTQEEVQARLDACRDTTP
ncbi:c-type cytochrome [Parapedobacter sp.]